MASYLDCTMLMHKYLLVFLLEICMVCTAFAQAIVEPVLEDTAYNYDEEEIDQNTSGSTFDGDVLQDTTINFNDLLLQKDSINGWKKKQEFGWIKNADSFLIAMQKDAENQPAMQSNQNRGSSFLDALFGSGIIQLLLWVGAGALGIFIVYKLFLSKGLFTRSSTKAKVELATDENDITLDNDYNALMKKAYAAGDYKNAMRFIFLKTLQHLNEKGHIKFALEKTNSIYVRELPAAKRNDFAKLALYYEYSWYGNVLLSQNTFNEVEIKFNHFLNSL